MKRLRRELRVALAVSLGDDDAQAKGLVERVGIPELARQYRKLQRREERRLRSEDAKA